ncbi:MAG: quinone-dependent dihydroorotate dehydrogenase [Alphaproteobacteria bacterium]|nr:quinone-dependent dihydroorotate dehydrogenase [Alphaproteobacteria bacterium]
MSSLYDFARPLIFRIDPERAHGLTIKALRSGLMPFCPAVENPALAVKLWDLNFPNPVGLSAGFDKNAEIMGPALKMGFGFAEAGTVTPKPQAGNPKPRVFRDPSTESVINRMGFPNEGLETFKRNLEDFLKNRPARGIVGVNIGMNKDQTDPAADYVTLIRELAPLADYLTINISSPNTPGLRDLQRREPLLELLGRVKTELASICPQNPPPLLVKLAPDLGDAQQEELASALNEFGIDGLILTNTTLDRPAALPPAFGAQKGGLSGALLTDKSIAATRRFYRLLGGKIPIIGVGGVSTGAQAYARIRAGASLVQIYTALVFRGPAVVNSVNKEILDLLHRDGFAHIGEAVGADVAL